MSNKIADVVGCIFRFVMCLCFIMILISTLKWFDGIQQSMQSVTLENEVLKQEVEELKETIIDLQNNQEEIDSLKETINNQQKQINEIK